MFYLMTEHSSLPQGWGEYRSERPPKVRCQGIISRSAIISPQQVSNAKTAEANIQAPADLTQTLGDLEQISKLPSELRQS
jgi:hypothetical protein